MENFDRRMLLAGLGLVGAAAAASASAGTLNPPPGPVAPTGKTTDEIEPRVDVQSLAGDATSVFLISQPGSYYLTGDINGISGKSAIAISADNVTLDLGGFALIGVAGATIGIEIRGARNQLAIQNGHIRSFNAGGIFAATNITSVRVEDVTIAFISSGPGIFVPPTSANILVSSCAVNDVASSGGILISSNRGTVERCLVTNCTGSGTMHGIAAQNVFHCEVVGLSSTGAGNVRGIFAINANECTVSTLTSNGTPIGINASVISRCNVAQIGSALALGGAIGLSGGIITDCNVNTVMAGGAAVTGVRASEATRCIVNFVSLAGGAGAATGIDADVITECQVSSVSSSASGNVLGLSAYTIARSCSVTTVTASGSGQTFGANTAIPGRTEGCVISGTMDVGISVVSGQTVTGCSTTDATTGIQATGTRNIIDGNNILGASTTGISVTNGGAANALVIRNQVRNCTTNIAGDSSCQIGPAISATGTIAGTNPWANFTD